MHYDKIRLIAALTAAVVSTTAAAQTVPEELSGYSIVLVNGLL